MSENFKKASEILCSNNNIDITNKSKEDFSYLENVNLSEIQLFKTLYLKRIIWEYENLLELAKSVKLKFVKCENITLTLRKNNFSIIFF